MARNDLIQALPGNHNYLQADGIYNSSKAVVGLPPKTASDPSIPTGQRSFKRILEGVLADRNGQRLRMSSREIADMLIINPHLNIKAVQAAHPNAELVKENGQMKLLIPENAPQVDTQAFQHNAGAVQQLLKQQSQKQGNAAESHPLTAVAADPEMGLEAPFGRVVAPGQISALLMGHGIPAASDVVTPQSVNALLQRAAKLLPVEKADLASMLENAYSHWDKLAWDT